ncbi:MAG: DinB family protein [Flavobacterium sp.]|uniref:hypothetical protein n=1 Tax=Flavobacterium sp. TaxID=239 RepID=UPI0011F920ED|nr:hypothetical protein [Flavobacterium sp.]RZJ64430.1 MAG: DinB family protein [Flavobacterium sp.]
METLKINVNDNRLLGLITLFDLHTDFYDRVLDGIPDEAAQNRLGTKANHIAWLAGSLLQERCELVNWFGGDFHQKHRELFDNHKGIQDGLDYPSLEDFKRDWKKVSPILRDILSALTTEKLDTTFDMEGMKMTNYEYVSFDIYREANCIGQIALWRRLLGFPAMKYE